MQETAYGVLRPPLGSARLAVIALIAALLTTGSPVAEQAVINSGQPPAVQLTDHTCAAIRIPAPALGVHCLSTFAAGLIASALQLP